MAKIFLMVVYSSDTSEKFIYDQDGQNVLFSIMYLYFVLCFVWIALEATGISMKVYKNVNAAFSC